MYDTVVVFCVLLLLGSSPPFDDRTAGAGVAFTLRNAATPEKHQIETMPGGVAILDYDGDGRLDIYFANGAPQPDLKKTDSSWHNRLFRNLGNWKFEDRTAAAGVAGTGYSFGIAAADYDGDGRADLFVSGMPSQLFRNRGDGSFEDTTAKAGVANRQQWPVGAAWFDYNGDGRLDLFVVNYVRWNPSTEPFCGDSVGRKYRTYCHPKHYSGLPNTLFRNNGDGSFTDVSGETGILAHVGKGMGVAIADYDSDGDPDIFVANDAVPDFLFRNDGGKFREVATEAGVALNDDGRALSSMGTDFRDIDNDGLPDLFVTALANETFPLFRNLGKGLFLDVTYPSRIGAATMPYSGWSTIVADLDNDGRKDIFTANGDVQDNTEMFSSRSSKQRNMILFQNADGTFRPELVGAPGLYRGAAFGDLDGDGRIDAVVTRLNEPAVLLRNVAAPGNWVAFRAPIGTRIRITAGGRQQWNEATSAVGYASSSDSAVHFGLGSSEAIDDVQVRWPSGQVQAVGPPKINSVVTLPAPQASPGP